MIRARVAGALVAGALGAGCGDNIHPTGTDAAPQLDANPTPDAPPVNDFTEFVHQQILTNTTETATPAPYARFATLPDNDLDDVTYQAYADLF